MKSAADLSKATRLLRLHSVKAATNEVEKMINEAAGEGLYSVSVDVMKLSNSTKIKYLRLRERVPEFFKAHGFKCEYNGGIIRISWNPEHLD